MSHNILSLLEYRFHERIALPDEALVNINGETFSCTIEKAKVSFPTNPCYTVKYDGGKGEFDFTASAMSNGPRMYQIDCVFMRKGQPPIGHVTIILPVLASDHTFEYEDGEEINNEED